jgi:hypothetical protein
VERHRRIRLPQTEDLISWRATEFILLFNDIEQDGSNRVLDAIRLKGIQAGVSSPAGFRTDTPPNMKPFILQNRFSTRAVLVSTWPKVLQAAATKAEERGPYKNRDVVTAYFSASRTL